MRHSTLADQAASCCAALRRIPPLRLAGRVAGISGLVVDIDGLAGHVSVGDRLVLEARDGRVVPAEIVGFRADLAQAMPFDALDGLGPGSPAVQASEPGGGFAVSDAWLGRVLDPLGRPLDGRGALRPALRRVCSALRRRKPPPVRGWARGSTSGFARSIASRPAARASGSGCSPAPASASPPCCPCWRATPNCDVAVLALVGERGREVREFLEDDLGADGLARSVVVVATSDAPPLLRRQAAYAAMTVAEHFRDQGRSVLLLMDSVTRFCLALREIGLSAGEPPATRGYPPSVFAELPRLLERAGPGIAAINRRRGPDHRAVHRAGRGRRPQRAGGGRRARHPGRACHPGPPDRRSAAAIPPWMCCDPCRARPPVAWMPRRSRCCGGRGAFWHCMRTWRTCCGSAPIVPAPIRRWTRRSRWRPGSRRCCGKTSRSEA